MSLLDWTPKDVSCLVLFLEQLHFAKLACIWRNFYRSIGPCRSPGPFSSNGGSAAQSGAFAQGEGRVQRDGGPRVVCCHGEVVML